MRSRHLYITLLSLWAATGSMAQSNQPNLVQTSPSGTNNATWVTPAEVNTAGEVNYIRSFVPLVPITDTADVNSSNQPGNIREQTAYLDGFMQSFQTVTRNVANVNGQAKHLVGIVYNYPTLEAKSFLPYASGSSGLQGNAFQAQRDYYNNLYPNEGYTSFSRSLNTSSATEYSTKGYLPGKSQSGQNRGTVTQVLSNAANEIIIWNWDESAGIPVASGYYAPLQLMGEQTVAPTQNNTAVSAPQSKAFKDKDGKLIVKMVATSNSNNIITYEYTWYVYDEKGNLRCTITPKAYQYYKTNNSAFTATVVKNLCFQYRYDNEGRLIMAMKPGEDQFTSFVYDAKDRVVLRQTPNELEENKWEVTFYDAQDRVKATSVFTDNTNFWDRQDWQSMMAYTAANGAPANTILYYIATPEGEGSYPDDNISDNEMMAYTYYDDYSMADPNDNSWNLLSNILNFTELVQGGEYPERSKRVYGAVTGSKVRILTAPGAEVSKTGEWRQSVIYYDDKGRIIYSGSAGLYQGNMIHYNLSGTQYDFANRVRINKHAWYNANSTNNIHSELTKYTYDAVSGALLNTKHKVDDGSWNVLNNFTYDDMGRVKRKSVGSGAEVQDMSYNIRGQLTGINGTYAETGNKEGYSRSFGESIKYDYGFTNNRYDGKMAGMVWRGSNIKIKMAYGYDYTQHQLLKMADFYYAKGILGSWAKTQMDYSVNNLKYDENGNITSMNQRGTKPGVGPVDMDILSYNYQDNSNRLDAVTDYGNAGNYGAGDFQENGSNKPNEYDYDPNGNLIKDGNKGITEVSYTFFNKPISTSVTGGTSFYYSYDASGGKVQEYIKGDPQQGDITTDYIGNAVYENDKLKYILTAEGRTIYEEGKEIPFKEEYFVKDHLGNVRSTLNAGNFTPRTYLAEYEIASANLENLVFDNIDELRETKPGEYTAPGTYKEYETMAARLNGNNGKTAVGSALLLHVMAGDKIDMKVQNYYDYYDPKQDKPMSPEDMVSNVITTLTGGYNGFEGENRNTDLVGKVFGDKNASTYNEMLQADSDPHKPRAYLNYVVFDEQMNIVTEASGAFQAQHEGNWGQIGTTEAMEMPVNGYIAVYLSNATLRDVYFDRLQVELVKSKLLEENHYYPHGLPILGLSSKDVSLAVQRRRYQGNEYIRNGGLNWMSFGARQYDPQIGRFLSIDPLAAFGGQDRYSPYAAMGNQPESAVDPNGLAPMAPEKAQAYGGESAGGWATDLGWALNGNTRNGGDVGGVTYAGGGGGFDTWGGLNAYTSDVAAKADRINTLNNMIGQAEANGGTWSADGQANNTGTSPVPVVVQNNNGDKYGGTINVTITAPKKRSWFGRTWRSIANTALDVAQTALDVVGLIPGVGEIADGANALIYLARGDYSNAALSAAAMIPVAGWAATTGKIGRRLVSGFQKHHVIPKAVYKEFATEFKAMGLVRDAGQNLKKLPTPFHGNHPAYSERVRREILQLKDAGQLNLQNMQNLQNTLRQEMNDAYFQGVERMNDYYKALGY